MWGKNTILGIIPARGGSKGVIKKNIKSLSGKPLIAYTIEAALQSSYIDRVIISTDDYEISNISRNFGAEVPYIRPSELAKDDSPTIHSILHMINFLELKENYCPDYICILQCTSPLRTSKHIDESIEKLLNSNFDALASVCEVESNPYWTNIFRGDKLEYFLEEGKSISRRQDLPKIYKYNGAIFIIKTTVLKQFKSFDIDNLTGFIMDRESSIDIDTELDFKIAELLIRG